MKSLFVLNVERLFQKEIKEGIRKGVGPEAK